MDDAIREKVNEQLDERLREALNPPPSAPARAKTRDVARAREQLIAGNYYPQVVKLRLPDLYGKRGSPPPPGGTAILDLRGLEAVRDVVRKAQHARRIAPRDAARELAVVEQAIEVVRRDDLAGAHVVIAPAHEHGEVDAIIPREKRAARRREKNARKQSRPRKQRKSRSRR